jgi:hypothetical protein
MIPKTVRFDKVLIRGLRGLDNRWLINTKNAVRLWNLRPEITARSRYLKRIDLVVLQPYVFSLESFADLVIRTSYKPSMVSSNQDTALKTLIASIHAQQSRMAKN